MFRQLLLGIFPEDRKGHLHVWIAGVEKRGKVILVRSGRGKSSSLKSIPSLGQKFGSSLHFSSIVVE